MRADKKGLDRNRRPTDKSTIGPAVQEHQGDGPDVVVGGRVVLKLQSVGSRVSAPQLLSANRQL